MWRDFDPIRWEGCSEEEYLPRIFPKESDTFLYQYLLWGTSITDASALYHAPLALQLLSTALPAHVVYPGEVKRALNLYVGLGGVSHDAHKSWALRLATTDGILSEVKPEKILRVPDSAEALIDHIILNPSRLLVDSEGGYFLKRTKSESGARLRKALNDVHDGLIQQRSTVEITRERKKAGKDGTPPSQANPRVSFAFCFTQGDLAEGTDESDWTTGFMRRYLWIYTKKGRNYDQERINPEQRLRLTNHLRKVFELAQFCGTCTGLTPDAQEHLQGWYSKRPKSGEQGGPPSHAAPAVNSVREHVLKMAGLMAFDKHSFPAANGMLSGTVSPEEALAWVSQPFAVDLDCVVAACAMGEAHLKSVWFLSRDVAQNEHGRMMRKMLMILERNRGLVGMAQVYDELELPWRTVDLYVETLERRLRAHRSGTTMVNSILAQLRPEIQRQERVAESTLDALRAMQQAHDAQGLPGLAPELQSTLSILSPPLSFHPSGRVNGHYYKQ